MNTTTKQEGFSIIEVVLVLAIAGLIFLMVFIALPALQRSQRDSAKQNEVGTVVSAIGTYQSSNNGRMPSSVSDIYQIIMGEPLGTNAVAEMDSGAVLRFASSASASFTADTTQTVPTNQTGSNVYLDDIVIVPNKKCGEANGSSISLENAGRRQVAVLAVQEGTSSIYCRNS